MIFDDNLHIAQPSDSCAFVDFHFQRLVHKMSDGTRLEINETGTAVRFFPGFITGGRNDCGLKRSLTCFMEGILPLAPFGDPMNSVDT